MEKLLKDIANIKFGLYAQSLEKGNATYLQARLFSDKGTVITNVDSFINIDEKSREHLLQEGDILLAGKGNRNFAWCYHKSFGPAVASSMFFIIQLKKDLINPDYLTAYFNLEKCQLFFRKMGEGSSVASIRKSELGELSVPVLSMKEQQEIVAISTLHQEQLKLSEKIQQRKEDLYEAVMNNLTTGK